MSEGVVMAAFGHSSYGKWAFNLALSIKRHNPDIQIQLLHDDSSLVDLENRRYFDILTPIQSSDIHEGNKFDPAKFKIHLYGNLAFDNCIYIDVDTICTKDIQPLFEFYRLSGKPYYVPVHTLWRIGDGEGDIPEMAWATAKTIWDHYKLDQDAVLPATQSSLQYIQKGELCESLFRQMQENYKNPIPLESLRYKWGGGQPDELYLNIALAQLGYVPELNLKHIYFSNYFNSNVDEILSHYFIGLFGGQRVSHSQLYQIYDMLMKSYCRDHFGIDHYFKGSQLIKYKHSNKKK